METFKFTLFSIVFLALFVFAGYWAVTTMQSGSQHVNTQKIKELQNENADLKKQVASLTSQVGTLLPVTVSQPIEQPVTPVKNPASVTAYKNQSLINELQKLIDANLLLKLNSQGTRVGTVQNFLNLYNKTSTKVDNNYSANMKTIVMAFQKDQSLPVSGQAGQATFGKMIDWLKKQG